MFNKCVLKGKEEATRTTSGTSRVEVEEGPLRSPKGCFVLPNNGIRQKPNWYY